VQEKVKRINSVPPFWVVVRTRQMVGLGGTVRRRLYVGTDGRFLSIFR
jgi:hypothetical protein